MSEEVKCHQCDARISNLTNLRRHIKAVHEKVRNFKCGECEYSSYERSALDRHNMNVHKGDRYNQYDYSASNPSSLSVQFSKMHGKRKSSSVHRSPPQSTTIRVAEEVQEEQTADEESQSRFFHFHSDDDDNRLKRLVILKCRECGARFYNHTAMRRHIMAKHERARELKCDECGFSSGERGTLERHLFYAHGIVEDCNQCGRCGLCSAGQRRKSEVHNFRENNQQEMEVYVAKKSPSLAPSLFGNVCVNCGAEFSSRTAMLRHVRSVHEKVRPFKCDLCDYASTQKSNFERHTLSIHGKAKMSEKKKSHGFEVVEDVKDGQDVSAKPLEVVPESGNMNHQESQHLKCFECQFSSPGYGANMQCPNCSPPMPEMPSCNDIAPDAPTTMSPPRTEVDSVSTLAVTGDASNNNESHETRRILKECDIKIEEMTFDGEMDDCF